MIGKTVLISKIAEEVGLSKAATKRVLDAFWATLIESSRTRETVRITGIGTFKPIVRRARRGVNPKTGEPIRIKERVVIKFKPGKKLRDGAAYATTHKEARDLAGLMIADLRLYHQKQIDAGLKTNNFDKVMEKPLKDAREAYKNRIEESIRLEGDYLEVALLQMAVDRKRDLGISD